MSNLLKVRSITSRVNSEDNSQFFSIKSSRYVDKTEEFVEFARDELPLDDNADPLSAGRWYMIPGVVVPIMEDGEHRVVPRKNGKPDTACYRLVDDSVAVNDRIMELLSEGHTPKEIQGMSLDTIEFVSGGPIREPDVGEARD